MPYGFKMPNSQPDLEKLIADSSNFYECLFKVIHSKLIKTKMVKASKNFNFVEAANLRDQIKQFEKIK